MLLSRKGGTGKTTLSVNLAVAAAQAGVRTAILDLDGQASARAWAQARGDRLPAIPVAAATGGTLFPTANAFERDGVQLLIVDTPANSDALTPAVLAMSDLVLLPTRPNYFDLSALAPTARTVAEAGRPAMIVLNQAPSRRGGVETPAIERAIAQAQGLGVPLAPAGLRSRTAYQESLWRGQGVGEFEPNGAAAIEVRQLWKAIADQLSAARPAETAGWAATG